MHSKGTMATSSWVGEAERLYLCCSHLKLETQLRHIQLTALESLADHSDLILELCASDGSLYGSTCLQGQIV